LGYERNRLRVEANYGNHYERYLENEDSWQNRNDHQYGLLGYYRILPRTSLLAQYRLTDINYTNQNNGDNTRGIDGDTSQDALVEPTPDLGVILAIAVATAQGVGRMGEYVVEGGEGEVGAGLEEQEGSSVMAGGSTITSPVMQASPSAFSGSGGRTTASGF